MDNYEFKIGVEPTNKYKKANFLTFPWESAIIVIDCVLWQSWVLLEKIRIQGAKENELFW